MMPRVADVRSDFVKQTIAAVGIIAIVRSGFRNDVAYVFSYSVVVFLQTFRFGSSYMP